VFRSRIDTEIINNILNFLGMGGMNVFDYLFFLEPLLAVAAFDAFKVGAI
jgi:hypothetical protein